VEQHPGGNALLLANSDAGRARVLLTSGMRRVLVLGGTAWLGREIARAALSDGAEVVCLARGDSGAVANDVHFVQADRNLPGAYDRLDGDWDEVVELANEPELIESALDALADRARHWSLVSTVSVYRRNDEPGADETAELVETDGLTDYAQAKVAAERATTGRVGDKLLVARPGLIVGPGDPSDRFGYWAARLCRGGRVLAPTTAGRFVQVIDVGDLAAWIVAAGRRGVTGSVNAVGESHAFDDFLSEAGDVAGFTGELVTVDDEWLLEHDVRHWAGPRSLPLWLPLSYTGFAKRNNAAYLAAGGIIRPLRDTISRVIDDEVARSTTRPRLAGLSPEEETDLLDRAP
jgi:2'-hydroxyisoflavone reductase